MPYNGYPRQLFMKTIISYLRNSYWKRWIRKHKCKVAGGLLSLHKRSTVTIEEGVTLGHVVIESKKLEIGAHTYIRSDCVLSAVSSIGRFCSIGSSCFIGQQKSSHPLDWLSSHPFQYTDTALVYDPEVADITIGHDVWIGHSAMILEGVTIGTGAVIATRALVAHDVPPYAIVAGTPAKVVKYRHTPELIEALIDSKWWDVDVEVLKTLPLNDPQATLSLLATLQKETRADYQQIEITRKGCSISS
ncbi:Acetyltransferase (isoleucine patch superfamily) [Pseudomonas jessenii]|uniref:Chloramphenicol acetyltransferase n=3 Tax=Pseudomonas TaxID=286 RepID=A0A1H4TA24_PSEJE|nr:Acetyltransferase (isoleucine patch superfamily) [Pseudomonas jessenii]VVP85800.1 2,3,4,5-tetrahydropyridine-2,6-dicarboxylate N-acetyltransferase [Pseudomonas fluorescens]